MGRDHLELLGVDGRMMLKWSLRWRVCPGFLFKHSNEHSCSIKTRNILTSQVAFFLSKYFVKHW
jgi:hypothetical protein